MKTIRDWTHLNKHNLWQLTATLLFVVAIGLTSAYADDSANPDLGLNPGPGARAVRLANVDGQVELSLGDQVLSDTALVNTPIFEGTRIATREDGRAEIQFEDGSIVRLSPNSAMILRVLRASGSRSETEIELDGGLAYFELQSSNPQNTMRVRYNSHTVTASGFTVIRISADGNPASLSVFSGNARVTGGSGQDIDIRGGETARLDNTNPSNYNLSQTIEPDSWDAWNTDRDQELNTASAARTDATNGLAQSNNPAWSDLDANGSWYNVNGEGMVWSPYEASSPDWDPYGNGYWGMSGMGPTWISNYSWGYMPYNCGTWNWYDDFGWGWSTGAGGCNPWWDVVGGGGGGAGIYYVANIGRSFHGYHPPRPPHDWPHRPTSGRGNEPGRHPFPVEAVNRTQNRGNMQLPDRRGSNPAFISGRPVSPMRPTHDHVTNSYTNGIPAGNPYNGNGYTHQPGNGNPNRPDSGTGHRPAFDPTTQPVRQPGVYNGGQPGNRNGGQPGNGGQFGGNGGAQMGGRNGNQQVPNQPPVNTNPGYPRDGNNSPRVGGFGINNTGGQMPQQQQTPGSMGGRTVIPSAGGNGGGGSRPPSGGERPAPPVIERPTPPQSAPSGGGRPMAPPPSMPSGGGRSAPAPSAPSGGGGGGHSSPPPSSGGGGGGHAPSGGGHNNH